VVDKAFASGRKQNVAASSINCRPSSAHACGGWRRECPRSALPRVFG
jgi:hypothetical protein